MEHILSGGKDQRGKDQLADEPARRRRGGRNSRRYQLSGGSQQTAVQRRSRLPTTPSACWFVRELVTLVEINKKKTLAAFTYNLQL